jgi:penicillin amidase
MRFKSWAIVATGLCAALFVGCSSPALRYLGYRLTPDRVPTEGETHLATPGLDATATIVFDRFGVPHIRAQTERDAAFALGYMHGRDRRFQLESLRRLAAGRVRELVGEPDAGGVLRRLETFSRLIGLYQDADALLAAANADEIALLDAYARGVNHATEHEPVPMEFRLLGVQPEAWTPRDSYLALAVVSFGLCKNWEHELGRLELVVHQLRTGSSIERALTIWKTRFDLPPHLFGTPLPDLPLRTIDGIAPELAEYLKVTVAHNAAAKPSASSDRRERDAQAGSPWDAFFRGGSSSNNWAMGAAWTRTGSGAMASDPHMPHSLPSLGYLAHVECAPCDGHPFRVIGAGFVGLPGITFGTNGTAAWSATANWADVTDLYVEKSVDGRPGLYATPGEPAAFSTREETFRIRQPDGSFAIERRTVRSSRHGPLVNDFVDRLPADFPLTALQRQGLAGHPISALRALYRAASVVEARAALNGMIAFTGHWALADKAGDVAYMPTARLPRRTAHLGTFAVPGWTARYDWDGFVPNGDIPWVHNPPSGFVASANNQVMDPDAYPIPVNFEGDVPNRFRRIAELLDAGRGQRAVERTRTIQLDGTDIGIRPLLDLYRPVLDRLAREGGAIGVSATALSAWDARHRSDGFEASLWNTLVVRLIERTLADEVSEATLQFVLSYFNIEPFVFSVLGDPSNPAWDDRRTAEPENFEQVVEAAFRDSVAALQKRYGSEPSQWVWSRVAPFVLEHPFGSQRLLAGYVNRPLPTTGSGNTVNKQQFVRLGRTQFPVKYGPVLRINVDLSDLASSRMSLPGGESGRPASQHYDDLLPLYTEGDGVPMEMDFQRIEAVGRVVLERR